MFDAGLFFSIYIPLIIFFYLILPRIIQRFFRKEWVARGREWRRQGWPRFDAEHKWIQKYFDEGYYGKKK